MNPDDLKRLAEIEARIDEELRAEACAVPEDSPTEQLMRIAGQDVPWLIAKLRERCAEGGTLSTCQRQPGVSDRS